MSADVLVVDDEPLVRRTLVEAVKFRGYSAAQAATGAEALRVLDETPCRLVFADIRMPELDGLELLRRGKARAPETIFVLVTGYGSVETAVEAMRAGADDFVVKPFSLKRVDEILERTLGAAIPVPATREDPGQPVGFLTRDPRVRSILHTIARVAPSPATVLIQGESGTGKELLARLVHAHSPRRERPFVAINCAALPETLLETELFGHERGAFTGAVSRRIGRFESAHQGTLLLDEISETSLALQAKLLRTLQEGEIDRVGGARPVRVDVRVIATTNRRLRDEIRDNRFRADLFYRLNVVSIGLPPLRERRGDLALLSQHFVAKFARAFGSPARDLSAAALRVLEGHPWPGNVRELENCIQRAVLLCPDPVLQPEHLHLEELEASAAVPREAAGRWAAEGRTFQEMERQFILETLERAGGNRTRAAKILGISVRTIRNKLREYRLMAEQTA
jgi:two-component system response regulator FlrC